MQPLGQLERTLRRFSNRRLRLMMRNLGAIQLTQGCSIGCPGCGVAASSPVTDIIPYAFLEELVARFPAEIKAARPLLYYASDPFDYQDGQQDYAAAHRLFEEKLGLSPGVSTAVPKGKEELILSYLLGENTLGRGHRFIGRISLSKMNYARLEKQLMKMLPLHATTQVGGFEAEGAPPDFFVRASPDAAPRSGDGHALQLPNGDVLRAREPLTFQHLIAYWNHVSTYRLNWEKQYYPAYIQDYYSGMQGRAGVLPFLLGEKNKDDLSERGIGCFNGVLMTPAGVYNLNVLSPSKRFPLGINMRPIRNDDFSVVQAYWLDVHGFREKDPVAGARRNYRTLKA